MIKTVIFDLWETLLTQGPVHPFFGTMEILGVDYEYNKFTDIVSKSKLIIADCSLEEGWRDAMLKLGIRSDEELLKKVIKNWTTIKEKSELFPNTIKTLEYLKKKKIEIGLCTALDAYSYKIMKQLLDSSYFDFMLLSFKEGETKPHFNKKVLKLTKSKPEEILFVGDNEYFDIKPAKEAGMKTAFISRKGKKSKIADYTILSLSELKKII